MSKLRNRVIGRVFHALGLIEQWGSGIQHMTAACTATGLAEPTLEEIATHFRVTLWAAEVSRPQTDTTDTVILGTLSEGRGLSTREIAELVGRSAKTTRTRLISLVERGLVVEVGSGPNDPRRRYYLVALSHSPARDRVR